MQFVREFIKRRSSEMSRLAGQVALVTGASGAIGSAIALELGRRGVAIAIGYYTRRDRAHAVRRELDELGVPTCLCQFDVRHLEEVERASEHILSALGKVTLLINNAGIVRDRSFRKMSPQEWSEVIEVDLTGIFNCTHVFVPHMIKSHFGRIVNISSVVGQRGAFGQSNYAAAKAGVIGFTKALAIELARYSITVNAVCPGYIQSRMLESVPEKIRDSLLQQIPLRRFGTPSDVARVVRFLLEEGDYITGQCINVNGGLYS